MRDDRPDGECGFCGDTATCLGRYGDEDESEFACDDCCNHSNEDGHCERLEGVND